MIDTAVFPEPMRFRTDRPLNAYLHFGTGIHRCIGGAIAHAEFEAMFTQLLQQPIRLPKKSRLVFDEGKALRHLLVEWAPSE